jgi:hypothetical protein
MDRDLITTAAGGGAGFLLLQNVQWSAVPYGEAVKIGVALALIIIGCLMYRGDSSENKPSGN